jgi:hypothetical protein
VLLLGVAGQGKVQGLCMQLHLRMGMATVCSVGLSGAALHSSVAGGLLAEGFDLAADPQIVNG